MGLVTICLTVGDTPHILRFQSEQIGTPLSDGCQIRAVGWIEHVSTELQEAEKKIYRDLPQYGIENRKDLLIEKVEIIKL